MIKKSIFTALALTSTLTFAQEKFPEPFGLTWGMQENELIKLGFQKIKTDNDTGMFISANAPKAWSKGDSYMALTHKGRLVKAGATSKNITNDAYGTEGKNLYNQVKNLLIDKYGHPSTNLESTGNKIYKDSDEFYQCLNYSGCGAYVSIFSYAQGSIMIKLEGSRRGEGLLRIMYESPEFDKSVREIKEADLEKDAEAF